MPSPRKPTAAKPRPSKEELQALLAEESYSAIARRFGVADTTIKKWARKYGMVQ